MLIKEAELHKIANTYGLPEYINSEEIDTDITRVPTSAFADKVNRDYPCHTKTACYISNARYWESAIFDEQADKSIGEALIKFASVWGISEDIKKNILSKVAESAKVTDVSELADSDFALTVNYNGKLHRLYPITDEDSVKVSAVTFFNDRHNLTYDQRTNAGKAIYEKLATYDADVPEVVADYLARAAGKGISSLSTISTAIEKRANAAYFVGRKDVSNELIKLAQSLKNQKLSKGLVDKLASAVASVDVECGLYNKYGGELELPEEEFRQVLYKDAESYLNEFVTFKNGVTYAKADLIKNASVFNSIVECDMVKASSTNAQDFYNTVSNLSPSTSDLVCRVLQSKGYKPADLPFTLSDLI